MDHTLKGILDYVRMLEDALVQASQEKRDLAAKLEAPAQATPEPSPVEQD